MTLTATLRLLVVAAALVLVSAGCSQGDEEADTQPARGIVAAEPEESETETSDEDLADGEPEGETAEDEEEVFARLEGTTITRVDLEPGDCFNEYRYRDRSKALQQITTTVDCGRPHDKEMYFTTEHPADEDSPYRGKDEIDRFARDECLDAFEEFVGEEYVLSQLEIGIFQPSYETWISDDRDREIGCYVYPYAEDRRLQGSMQGIGL